MQLYFTDVHAVNNLFRRPLEFELYKIMHYDTKTWQKEILQQYLTFDSLIDVLSDYGLPLPRGTV